MSRDSSRTHIHLHKPHHADLFEDFTTTPHPLLQPDDIQIPPHHQPINPEDEDDVVPDQHAAFGITRAMAARDARRENPIWRDFSGLDDLVAGRGMGLGAGAGAAVGVAVGAGPGVAMPGMGGGAGGAAGAAGAGAGGSAAGEAGHATPGSASSVRLVR